MKKTLLFRHSSVKGLVNSIDINNSERLAYTDFNITLSKLLIERPNMLKCKFYVLCKYQLLKHIYSQFV